MTINMSSNGSLRVFDLMKNYEAVTGVLASNQQLFCNEVELDRTSTFNPCSASVGKGNTITVCVSQCFELEREALHAISEWTDESDWEGIGDVTHYTNLGDFTGIEIEWGHVIHIKCSLSG
jgi:hypothetical protein